MSYVYPILLETLSPNSSIQEKKPVDAAMKTAWYVLVGEQDTKEADCTMTGAYWLEAKSGEYRCFYLTRPSDSHNCGNNDPKTV